MRDPKGWYRSVTESFWDVVTMAPSPVAAIYSNAYVFINVQMNLTVRDPKGWYRSMTDVIVMVWSSVIAKYAYIFNVQVVLTVRDPKGWYRSVTESFWDVIAMARSSASIRLIMRLVDGRRGAGTRIFTQILHYCTVIIIR